MIKNHHNHKYGPLENLVVLVPISSSSLDKLKDLCKVVHYHPDGQVPHKVFKEGEVWFCGTTPFPEEVKSVDDVPKARVLQLSSGKSIQISGAVESEVGLIL
jgi:hypothetical protein